MTSKHTLELDTFINDLRACSPHQPEFHQAVEEVAQDVIPLINDKSVYRQAKILERMSEPDRIISFRVTWQDDSGEVRVNRGYRVQFNSAIGPYKGGLRFHPSVNESVLKFLGFEQTFKNALTGLPMGGGKGGADFDPSGCSDDEIMRFCQAFMLELHRHIQPDVDVPAGDINVGAREIGYLFGAYKRITNEFEGVLTGKGLSYGGSEMRTEATGYGLIAFTTCMLEKHDRELDGQRIIISGAGNVASYAAEKAIAEGGRVITLSDSGGFILDNDGVTQEKIDWVRQHKSKSCASLKEYASKFGAQWHAEKSPWGVECDIALPCATQNELDDSGVKSLINNGCHTIAEGANMPVTSKGKTLIDESDVLFAPAKASNAGGVAMSGLEISQNRMRRSLSREELDQQLHSIMRDIHETCVANGEQDGRINYAKGANIAGFKKVADAMLAQGII